MDVLVVENEGVDFSVVESGCFDFLELVIESIGQEVQYQKELFQVLFDFVLDLD